MSNSSLHNKTIRPGSLNGYSYYYSNRQAPPPQQKAKPKLRLPPLAKKLAITAVLLAAIITLPMLRSDPNAPSLNSAGPSNQQGSPAAVAAPTSATKKANANYCAGNTLDKFIKISVTERHLWACEGEKEVHDSPVITGMLMLPETLTPPGTYKIYAKQTNTTLTGSDSAGSWNYPVHYWMPFLDNQYGTYGFHDATWRPDTDFGNIDPNTKDASHGCIELQLGSAEWLYNWAPVETVLTVES